jgi:two-component system sensor histidine kinase/response regulator
MKKILIIDDEDDLRTMMVKVLKEEGFHTIEADNGSSALTLAKNHRPDLIISDVIMDSGSGFMLQELLQDDPQTAAIPLILMTGQSKHAGAWESDPEVGYLAKPFGVLELLSAVARKLSPKPRV